MMTNRYVNTPGVRRIWSVSNLGVSSEKYSYPSAATEVFTVLNPGTTNGNFRDPGPCHFVKDVYTSLNGSETTTWPPGVGYTRTDGASGPTGEQPSHLSTPSGFSPTAFNKALESVNDQVRGGFDLSVFSAEMPKTTKMVANTLNTATSGITKTSRRLVKYIREIGPRNWPNKWLEVQYGWKPLIHDIYNFADSAQKAVTRPENIQVRGRGSDRFSNSFSMPWAEEGTRVKSTHASYRCEISLNIEIKPSVLGALGDFTALNPLSLAWELMPYSFVIDWVYNVGGYLRNLETSLLYAPAFRSGYVTETIRRTTTESRSWGYTHSVFKYSAVGRYVGSAISSEKRRVVLTAYPLPRPPMIKADLGSSQLISAAALLSQFLGRK